MSDKSSAKQKKPNKNIGGISDAIFATKEISGMGKAGTMKLLRGRAIRILSAIGRAFSYTSVRAYGAFFMSFGLFTLVLNLGEYYFRDEPVDVWASLIVGCALILLSVPFILFDKPICIAFQDFSLTDYLFFEFFSINRMHRTYDGAVISPFAAFVLGIFPALLEFFVSPLVAIATVMGIVFVCVALNFPEFPIIFTLLVLPYMSIIPGFKILLACLSVLSFISFVIKVVVGKRVYHFDIYTVLLFLWIVFAIIGGVVIEGNPSLYKSLYLVAISLGYFPASNLIINRRLADCAINAIIVSALPVSLAAIAEFVIELPMLPIEYSVGSDSDVSATFGTSSALAAFLIVSSVLTFAFSRQKRNKKKKDAYFLMFLINFIALLLTRQPAVWFAIILSFSAYFILRSKKTPADIIIFLFALPHLIFLIPAEIFDKLFSLVGLEKMFSETVLSYSEGLKLFVENIFFGVSISKDSFSGGTGASVLDDANLIIGLGAELGIFVLSVFLIMMLVRLRHISAYKMYYYASTVETSVNMTALATLALLFFGIGEYVFADSLILYLFLSVFGICGSAIRTAKKDNDERLGYYSDARSSESSAIDISLK